MQQTDSTSFLFDRRSSRFTEFIACQPKKKKQGKIIKVKCGFGYGRMDQLGLVFSQV
jgi:hypothetical protein